MIQPTRGRILVRMLPVTGDLSNSHDLIIVDKKKHFEHKSRRGRVEATGRGVWAVSVGDVVVFRGDAGFSMDYDPEQERLDESVYRWLREDDCLAVEETVTEPQVPPEVVA